MKGLAGGPPLGLAPNFTSKRLACRLPRIIMSFTVQSTRLTAIGIQARGLPEACINQVSRLTDNRGMEALKSCPQVVALALIALEEEVEVGSLHEACHLCNSARQLLDSLQQQEHMPSKARPLHISQYEA